MQCSDASSNQVLTQQDQAASALKWRQAFDSRSEKGWTEAPTCIIHLLLLCRRRVTGGMAATRLGAGQDVLLVVCIVWQQQESQSPICGRYSVCLRMRRGTFIFVFSLEKIYINQLSGMVHLVPIHSSIMTD